MTMTARPSDPPWLKGAFGDLGLHEKPGAAAHPRIVEMYARAGHPGVKGDETAWCSAAANTWMVEAGIRGTGSLLARSWLAWGRACATGKRLPRGAVVVFRRGSSSWQGHVAMLLDDRGERLAVIGGNQSDGVTIALYPRAALVGARWPDTVANSRTIQSLVGAGAAELGQKIAGSAADHVTADPDAIAQALGQAQAEVQQYAMMFRTAQYLLIALTLAALGYAIWRFVTRHLRPPAEPAIADGPALEGLVPIDERPARPRRRRRPA